MEIINNVPYIRLSMALTILKATLNQFLELLTSQQVIANWRTFLLKRKKFTTELENLEEPFISSDKFFELVLFCRMTDISEG